MLSASLLPAGSRRHLPSLVQLIISLVAFFISLLAAALVLLAGVFSLVSGDRSNALTLFAFAWETGFVALLLLPSALFSLFRILGKNWILPRVNSLLASSLSLLLLPPLWVAGALISSRAANINWLVLPPIQILVVVIPLWWLIELGCRGLIAGSPQRTWGTAAFALAISPILIIIAEILVLMILVVVFAIWAVTQPGMVDQIQILTQNLRYASGNPSEMEALLSPLLQNPVVIIGVLAIVAGIIPIMEELMKPMAVWILMLRPLKPAEGFIAGLICGSAFALIESLNSLANPLGTEWLTLVIGRLGTGILHTVSAGLVGWGLATLRSAPSAFKSYLNLAGSFVTAFVMHASWNTFATISGIGSTITPLTQEINFGSMVAVLAGIAPYAMVLLGLAFLVVLLVVNRQLQKSTVQAAGVEILGK